MNKRSKTYQICNKCVMDVSDSNIVFNEEGICNHCLDAELKLPRYQFTKEEEDLNLISLKNKIISNKSEKSEYDSILGLSGGVDSTYVAYLAYKMGLNPLCVHFDNGWNSETSVNNINKIIEKTKFDLDTYVINWPEFKDLQRSFLLAGVKDVELITDHAIFASLFKIRKKNKIKFVLSGTNYATEHGLPMDWIWAKTDKKNILSIHKKFGKKKIKSFPFISFLGWEIMTRMGIGGEFVEILNMVCYNKSKAMDIIKKEFSWEYYGGKHYESRFTKFYQTYILPKKFNIDKRKCHLSALIRNREMTREQALEKLQEPIISTKELENDYNYVIKKLDFSKDEFDDIMTQKPIPHAFYGNNWTFYNKLNQFLKNIGVKS